MNSHPPTPEANRVPPRALRFGLLLVALICALTAQAERFPEDPVEQFKQALLLENSRSLFYKNKLEDDAAALKLAVQFREQNLEKAAKNLKTASELSRALLLIDWPTPPKDKFGRDSETKYDRESRDIERKVRSEMIARFGKLVRQAFETEATSVDAGARQIATANMVGETVGSAGIVTDDLLVALYADLQPLAKDLAKLTASPQFRVREAAARALGQFPLSPKVASEALAVLLKGDNPASTRKAAADALQTLALNVSTNRPIKGSEPGISVREVRKSAKIFELDEVVALVKNVVRAATPGIQDPDASVREAAVGVLRQSSEALAFEVRRLLPTSLKENDLPPNERRRSAKEEERVKERRQFIDEQEKTIAPALRAFRSQRVALLKAAIDGDPIVRLNARRTLDSLAQTRDLLLKLRDTVPPPQDPEEKKADAVRAPIPPRPRVVLPTIPVVHRQDKDEPKKDKDEPKREKDEPKKEKELDEDDKDDKDPDPIGTLLRGVGEGLVKSGFRDPNAAARRASHEALEALGPAAAEFVPALVTSLKDPDVFVRWMAARTLGKVAPRQAELIVPGLACVLDDPDLDPRISAAKSIGQFGPRGASAVPALVARLHKGDAEFRLAVMKALEDIGSNSASALPALVKSLNDIDPRVRGEAARVIGRFGPLASAYVGELRKRTADPDGEVRKAVSGAILAIVPEK